MVPKKRITRPLGSATARFGQKVPNDAKHPQARSGARVQISRRDNGWRKMTPYKNLGTDSGVVAYEIGGNVIRRP